MFRILICPSSGVWDYTCVIAAYGVGCWWSAVRSRAAGCASGMREIVRLNASSWFSSLRLYYDARTNIHQILTIFICFVFISEQTATSAPYNINWFVFYNRDEKCFLSGTNWVFKLSGLRFLFKRLMYRFMDSSILKLVLLRGFHPASQEESPTLLSESSPADKPNTSYQHMVELYSSNTLYCTLTRPWICWSSHGRLAPVLRGSHSSEFVVARNNDVLMLFQSGRFTLDFTRYR